MLGDAFPLSNRVGLEVCDDAIKSAHTLGDVSTLGNTGIVLSIFEKGNLGYVEMDRSSGQHTDLPLEVRRDLVERASTGGVP
ncbi:unnamed protein product [Ilex paraguariensis]|uniref:DUF4926 domain-containing protein n=1 Tax=Ilex paraguariensis TaxID=185542 RepID=A0ABC8RBD1_9AQUA